MNQLTEIKRWIEDAGQEPGRKNTNLYIGLCCEEMAEMLEDQGCTAVAERLRIASQMWRLGPFDSEPTEGLLDAACDLIWVATGLIVAMGIDPTEALQRVIDSNNSKRQADGTFLKDETGKIQKPDGYKPPNWEGLL